MGRMSAGACERWRQLLAVEVVGRLDEADAVGLGAHLEGCGACRDERTSLLALRPALEAADPLVLAAEPVPPSLRRAVIGGLRAEARQLRSRRRWTSAGIVAAAAAAAAAAVLVVQPWNSSTVRTLVLHGAPGVHATASLRAETWGAEVVLDERGQPGGQVMSLSMRTTKGLWWEVGTYRSVSGEELHVTMACAVAPAEIEALYVLDSRGRTVLASDT